MKELSVPVQLNLGLFPSEQVVFSEELLDVLRHTSPHDLLSPAEKQELREIVDESYRARIRAIDDAGRMPLF